MVSGFTSAYSVARPAPPTSPEKTSVSGVDTEPRGKGLARVRAIKASIFCSTRQLTAAAAPATSQMPIDPNSSTRNGTGPSVASNIPMIAVKTIKATTRGFVSWKYCSRREASCEGKVDTDSYRGDF